ncbi:cupin domain-containing protein [Streptomyces sp. 21So2-11]|uniref:cupin domain-containing protein n=1 Tax=Streptomyces sp. 21So2-11 TaxID=3144408 RepID=UPI00321A91B6
MTTGASAVVARLGEDFLAQAYGRTYRVVRGDATTTADLFGWEDLNTILAQHRLEAPRLRLSAGGEMLHQHTYARPFMTRRSTVWHRMQPNALHARLSEGATLVLDAVDELHYGAQTLAAELERFLRTGVQINLYASWTDTEGFGTHWDDHDVVVVQLDGAKRWKLYGPTRKAPLHRDVEAPEPPPEEPVVDLVLTSGDVLYLPRGWWHAVAASEGQHSLHLTCGLQTVIGADVLIWLADVLRAEEAVRGDVPRLLSEAEQRAYAAQLGKIVSDEFARPDLIDRFLAARDAGERLRLRPSLPYLSAVPPQADLPVRLLANRPRLTTDADGLAVLAAGGEEWSFAGQARPLLDLLLDGQSHALGVLAEAAQVSVGQAATLVTELVSGQIVAVGGER